MLPLSAGGRRYGALRSPRDPRDFTYARFARATPPPFVLPASTHNREFRGSIRDQGSEGSCTAHAGRGSRLFLANKFQGNANKVDYSPADIYYLERQKDGTLDQGDCGSTGRTCCQVLNQNGACPEGDDPYVAGQFSTPPSPQALADGLKWRAGSYHALTNIDEMKNCMASGYPFIVGFTVYSSFEQPQIAATGLMPVPDKGSEEVLGGHEVLFLDYDDSITCPGADPGAFLVDNSWGVEWGQKGSFWFPYQCAADSSVLMDAFIQHLGRAW